MAAGSPANGRETPSGPTQAQAPFGRQLREDLTPGARTALHLPAALCSGKFPVLLVPIIAFCI